MADDQSRSGRAGSLAAPLFAPAGVPPLGMPQVGATPSLAWRPTAGDASWLASFLAPPDRTFTPPPPAPARRWPRKAILSGIDVKMWTVDGLVTLGNTGPIEIPLDGLADRPREDGQGVWTQDHWTDHPAGSPGHETVAEAATGAHGIAAAHWPIEAADVIAQWGTPPHATQDGTSAPAVFKRGSSSATPLLASAGATGALVGSLPEWVVGGAEAAGAGAFLAPAMAAGAIVGTAYLLAHPELATTPATVERHPELSAEITRFSGTEFGADPNILGGVSLRVQGAAGTPPRTLEGFWIDGASGLRYGTEGPLLGRVGFQDIALNAEGEAKLRELLGPAGPAAVANATLPPSPVPPPDPGANADKPSGDAGRDQPPDSRPKGTQTPASPQGTPEVGAAGTVQGEAPRPVCNPLPVNPDSLLDQGYKEVTHPKQAAVGHREFVNPDTGDKIAFDKGKPGERGFEGVDHYHHFNPQSKKNDAEKYLDKDGNVVRKGSKKSHLLPGD